MYMKNRVKKKNAQSVSILKSLEITQFLKIHHAYGYDESLFFHTKVTWQNTHST